MDLWLIGIGTGNPEHVTLEARRALREAGTILVPRKGPGKDDLAGLRHRILRDARAEGRVVEFDYPVRDEALPYRERVIAWHDEIARRWVEAVGDAEGSIALLVWGDPSRMIPHCALPRDFSPHPTSAWCRALRRSAR